MVMLGALLAWIGWRAPRTPEALFAARCASCHELRRERLCEFAPHLRAAIVAVMRREHGADELIDEREAQMIATYLRERIECR
jgi:mono/diheme cytochrome c family protein